MEAAVFQIIEGFCVLVRGVAWVYSGLLLFVL